MLIKRFCEYKYCSCPNKKLPVFKSTFDRGCRFLHKKCFNEVKYMVDYSDYIKPNPLNITYERCIANKRGTTERCKNTVYNTKGFNTKTGYCPCHNNMNYWKKHG